MKSEIPNKDIPEIKQPMDEGFKKINAETSMSLQDLKDFWKNEINNISENFKDHLEERELEKAKTEKFETDKRVLVEKGCKGEWSGKIGDSKFVPNDVNARDELKKYGQDGIEYKNYNPDFSKVSEATVKIDNMTSDRPFNFKLAYTEIAKKWSKEERDNKTDWTPRDVKQWKKDNHYVLHENADMKTMDLIPTKIHEVCKHFGGVAECKLRGRNVKFDD